MDLFQNSNQLQFFIKQNKRSFIPCSLVLLFLNFFLISHSLSAQKPTVVVSAGAINIQVLANNLNHPWGMEFLPDGRLIFTERSGTVRILDTENNVSESLAGIPEVFARGQGGMLDIALDPDFENNNFVYLSFAEPGSGGTASTALGRGKLQGNELKDFEVIFRMEPKVEGPNHFGGRIVFTDQEKIFLTLAERFKFDPAQDLSNHMGSIVRINRDGTVPEDNPFIGRENTKEEIWSYGHRNIESAAIDPTSGNLWIAEMGPMGGDEMNMPEAGKNYGWPLVSHGKNYNGTGIPHPATRPELEDAKIVWTPTISPSGMIFYAGDMFHEWKGQALVGGLTSTGIVRVLVKQDHAEELERIPVGVRTRDVAEAPDGSLYVLTDEDNGKILRLSKIR